MKKRIIAALAALSVLGSTLALSGCTFTSSNYNAMQDYDFSSIQLVQLEDPQEGDTIAIFDTDLGEFRAVLYDEYCPNTVAAFVERANAGKYDGLPVYAVVQDTYFLTGGHENDKGVYTGRDSDDEALAHEYNVDLWPFRGALVTYSELPGYSDARYLVCNNDDMALGAIDACTEAGLDKDTMPFIVGVDATPPALEALREGTLKGTVRNDATGLAENIMHLAASLSAGGEPSRDVTLTDGSYVWLRYEAVTAESLED